MFQVEISASMQQLTNCVENSHFKEAAEENKKALGFEEAKKKTMEAISEEKS